MYPYRLALIRWARLASGCAVALFVGAAVHSRAHAAAPSLPPGAKDLGWGGRMRINGADMNVRLFRAPGSPLAVGAAMARQVGRSAWLLPMPDGVMLTGADGVRPWLVQLRQAGPQVSAGVVAIAQSTRPFAPVRAPWLPEGGELWLDVESVEDGVKVVQQVCGYPDDAVSLARALDAALRRGGWRRTSASAGAASQWRRAGRLLQLLVVESGAGSAVVSIEIVGRMSGWRLQ